ncbi:MAG TPA: 3-deoxy-8-phosphooctulonate synthase, partial [Bacteroidota bacterium]
MIPVSVGSIRIGGGHPLVLLAGPCVVESRELTLRTAEAVRDIAARCGMPVVFKASYKKANRTSGRAFTGIAMDQALAVLQEVRSTVGLPVLTDIHAPEEAMPAAEAADILQIPA